MSNTSHPDPQHGKPAKEYNIVVNGTQVQVATDDLTFAEIIEMAFPGQSAAAGSTFTVVYRKAAASHHEGTLLLGESVKIIEGTVFNVTATTKS